MSKLEVLRDWLKPECNLDYTVDELKNLMYLSLWGKNLTKIPSEIGELKNLTCLHLSGNNLTQLPPEISQLKNLKELYLWDNNLTQLPPEILNLKLVYFYCDKVYVRESDKKMIEFLKKHWQEYQVVQETLLTDTLI